MISLLLLLLALACLLVAYRSRPATKAPQLYRRACCGILEHDQLEAAMRRRHDRRRAHAARPLPFSRLRYLGGMFL